MILWSVVALAAPDAILAEIAIPPGARVELSPAGAEWRIVVTADRTRTLVVRAPETEEERRAVVALVESLLVELVGPAPEPGPRPALPEPAPSSVAVPVPVPVPDPQALRESRRSELMTWSGAPAADPPIRAAPASAPPEVPLRTAPDRRAKPTTALAVAGASPTAGTATRAPSATPGPWTSTVPSVPAAQAAPDALLRTDPQPEAAIAPSAPVVPSATSVTSPSPGSSGPSPPDSTASVAKPTPAAPTAGEPAPPGTGTGTGTGGGTERGPGIHAAPWLALDTAFRPGLAPSVGGWVGATVAVLGRLRAGIAAGWHPGRPVPVAPDALVTEADLALELVALPVDWLVVRGGVGLAVRDWVQYGDRVVLGAVPRASVGAETRWQGGPWALAVGAALDVDLARTVFSSADHALPLFPITARPIVRIEFGQIFRTPPGGADIGAAGTRNE